MRAVSAKMEGISGKVRGTGKWKAGTDLPERILETEPCEAGHHILNHILNSSCSKQIFVVYSSGGAFQVPYRKQ